ncbi:MAG: MFS transporter [Promethearchaeota archaeon]|nr:MAG: MFS transporter [Candidatus Lokiarchaeota archaeon]
MIPIILVVLLLFVSIACANMLIPSYSVIKEEFDIPEAFIAIPDALFLLVSAFFALMWGYFTDRINRAKVIRFGAFSWTIGMVLTAYSQSYEMLILSRMLSGAGLGCVLPVGYSIISDAIPPEERSGWFGALAILSSISNGTGQALSSFIGPLLGWRFPFILLSFISFFIIIILFFVKIPQRGASESELLDLAEFNLEYSYKISKEDLIEILRKKTNRRLIAQGFLTIIPGTILVYFLTSMLVLHYFAEIPEEIRLQTASIFAGMVGIGYILGNVLISRLSDAVYRRNKRNRARLATICMILAIPLCLIMLFLLEPVRVSDLGIDYPDPIPPQDVWQYIFLTVQRIFQVYPNYIWYFAFGLIGATLGAAPVSNKNAIMIDVNMPEHKGTSASFFNLSEQIGKGVTLLISFMLISLLGSIFNMMVFSVFFWIPAAFFWYLASRSVEEDMNYKSRILSERKQVSLIDFIFELEIQMDRAIQKVQDSKYYIESDPTKFNELLNDAIKIFSFCEQEGVNRSITNIEKKAHILKLKTILIKTQANQILKELENQNLENKDVDNLNEKLRQLKKKISEGEISTFGEVETYYEDAYLKIVEARLNRQDLIKSRDLILKAIHIYERVKYLLLERIEEVEQREDEDEEEQIVFNKENELLEKCSQSLLATLRLKEEIDKVFAELRTHGIHQADLRKISLLTSEYQVDLYNVIIDTFGQDEETRRDISSILQKIDEIFNEYDKTRPEYEPIF